MTTRELTNVALKVFAIYILLQAVSLTPMLYQAVTMLGENIQNQSGWLMGVGIATLVALVVISVLIWKMANSFLEKTTPVGGESESTPPVGESFLLSLLGIYLTFEGLQRFGFVCVAQYTKVKVGVSEEELSTETILYLFGYFVQFILGLSLILKSNGWVAILRSIREVGLEKSSSNKGVNNDAP